MQRVAIHPWASINRIQAIEKQRPQMNEVAQRLGRVIVYVYTGEGISSIRDCDRRSAFDKLMRGITRRQFPMVTVCSVYRFGRSLQDLVGLLRQLQARGVGLYSHTQALDTTTPFGWMVLGAKATRTLLGRPPMPTAKVEAIRSLLVMGIGIRETAWGADEGTASVMRVKQALKAAA